MGSPPLCVELFCGTFGWSQGWLDLGGEAVGFDIEHEAHHGPVPRNAHFALQDVRTLHGKQFRHASLILASPPCQEFSYRAMPWKRARELGPPELGMELFHACFRIQREACEAAGRYIPMVVENVKGAQKYVGRARWHFGSYYLWGDVPALMPETIRGAKNTGGSWFNIGSPGQRVTNRNPVHRDEHSGVKQAGLKGHEWFDIGMARHGSKSPARKAASALVARIPERLSRHIAETYWPSESERVA